MPSITLMIVVSALAVLVLLGGIVVGVIVDDYLYRFTVFGHRDPWMQLKCCVLFTLVFGGLAAGALALIF